VVPKRDLADWEKDYGGRTAEEIARRVIARFRPSEEELRGCRNAGQRRGGGGGQGGDGGGDKGGGDALAASDLMAVAADEHQPGDAGESADGIRPFRCRLIVEY
jgi:hypothetical protein